MYFFGFSTYTSEEIQYGEPLRVNDYPDRFNQLCIRTNGYLHCKVDNGSCLLLHPDIQHI
jgi:hypothetical protein